MTNLITANMMVRDEPFAVYGLASIIDYVDEAIVVDTGSEDGTWEELQDFCKDYPDKIKLSQEKVANCHDWCIKNHNVIVNVPKDAATRLGDIRREMHEGSSGKYIWLIDGDEVYFKVLAVQIREIIETYSEPIRCYFLPFIDYIDKVGTVRLYHYMGRIFLREKVGIKGDFTAEMHFNKDDSQIFLLGSPLTAALKPSDVYNMVQHFESIVKPARKEHEIRANVPDVYPEVFYRLCYKYPRIKKYIEV